MIMNRPIYILHVKNMLALLDSGDDSDGSFSIGETLCMWSTGQVFLDEVTGTIVS